MSCLILSFLCFSFALHSKNMKVIIENVYSYVNFASVINLAFS